jgi:RHS repeat-associated protein
LLTADGWTATADADYPATAIWRGDTGPAQPQSGEYSFVIGNLGDVDVVSPRVALGNEDKLTTRFWLQADFNVAASFGGLTLTARYYDGQTLLAEMPLWSTQDDVFSTEPIPGWQEIIVDHQAPIGARQMELAWQGEFFNGWLTLDDIAIVEADSQQVLASWDLNDPPDKLGWSALANPLFPAGTAWWDETAGRSNSGGYILSNEGGGAAQTRLFPATPEQAYQVQTLLRGEAVGGNNLTWQVKFYNNDLANGESLLWSAKGLTSKNWQTIERTFTTPANTTHFELLLTADRIGGWLAMDGITLANLSHSIPAQGEQDYDLSALVAGEMEAAGQESAALIVIYYDGSGAQLGVNTVWAGVDYSQTPAALQSGTFTTPANTAALRVGLAASIDNDVAEGWLLFDRVTLTALSQPVSIVPGQTLDLSARVRGVLDGPSGQTSGRVAAHFYDNQGNLLAVNPIWQTTDYNQPTTPLQVSGSTSHATATQMRVGLMTVLDEGWLAFDTVKLTSLSAPITARPNQYHKLSAQVSGQLNSANSGRLFVKYNDGTIPYMWQNTGVLNGSQSVSGNFTTPANVSSFQVGTEVVLDKGHLTFADMTLTAYSDLIAVEGGGWYQLDAQITGEVVAGLGEGGRILLLYNTQPNTPLTAWRNPINFSGTVTDNSLFIPSQNTTQLFILLETDLNAGHLTFSDLTLQHLADGDIIQRSTYSVAGQSIAVKVEGDPVSDNNGLFFTYSDHLGSTSTIANADNEIISQARYLPFGGYRGTLPSQTITDRGYTGHKHNDNLGLIYMNARYYSPYINRFISADTIVPDPTNPQSFNRYSYVNNNPLKFVDPSGHFGICFQQGPTDQNDDNLDRNSELVQMCTELAENGFFGDSGSFDVFGNDSKGIQAAVNFLRDKMSLYPDEAIVVMGYSYGGGGALDFAALLDERGGDYLTIQDALNDFLNGGNSR